jgi:hypothetical protein
MNSNAIRKWNDSAETILPIIQKLLKAGLRIWIYRYADGTPFRYYLMNLSKNILGNACKY